MRVLCVCVCVAFAGRIMVATAEEIPETVPSTLRFTRLMLEDGLPSNAITDLMQDRQGFVWIGTEDGLVRYDGYTVRVFQAGVQDGTSLSHSSVTGLVEGADGRIWIGTQGGGINIFDPRTERFSYLLHDSRDSHSLSSDSIFKLFLDSDGDLWFGSMGGAPLTRYRPATDTFDTVDINVGNYRFAARDIHEDDQGQLWIAAEQELIRLDLETEAFTSFQPDESVLGEGFDTHSLDIDPQGNIWTHGRLGTRRFDPVTESFTKLILPALTWDMHFVDHERAWVATGGGLKMIDLESGAILETYLSDTLDEQSLSSNFIRKIMVDEEDVVWIGTIRGVNRFDPRQTQFMTYRYDPRQPQSLAYPEVTAVHGDNNGRVWIATRHVLNLLGCFSPTRNTLRI